MITINLLPKDRQKPKRQDRLWRLIILINTAIITVLIWISGGLYGLSGFLKHDLSDLGETEAGLVKRVSLLQADFEEIKKQIDFLKNLPLNDLAESLEAINSLLPPGIEIQNIEIESGVIKIKGKSRDREQVIVFEKNLRTNFPEVEAPLSNLVKPINADFIFTIKNNAKQE